MTDAELLASIHAEEQSAIGGIQQDIASDREDAIKRYRGEKYGDEQKGRSQVVSRDVADTVDGVLANVVRPFVSGDTLVQFDPIGPEDEEAAQQETDYVNHIVLDRSNGFLMLSTSVKDALLLRNGYVRVTWTKRDDVRLETYYGMSEEEFKAILADADVEVAQHSEVLDQQGSTLHDLVVRRKRPTEYAEVQAVPPDDMLVGERTTCPSLQEADFVQYRPKVTISYLRQQGYEIDDDINDDDSLESLEDTARRRFGTQGTKYEDETDDPSRRLVMFKETFIRIDRDGDGIAELRRVCAVGMNLLSDEETDIIPIASFTGTLMQHQHLGVSLYDQVADLAELKTALLRQFMDGKYLANNSRTAIDQNKVNVADLLISRPGGIVRVDGTPMDSMMPLPVTDTGPSALQGLEYLDSVRENRTGYTRYAQGMGSDSLINKTATGLLNATSQSQLRLEMVARTIAETGLRDVFRIVHAITLKHATKAEKIRLRNKWVLVDPRTWFKRSDLSINIGLGTGTPDVQLARLQGLAPLLQQATAMGLSGPQEAYNYGVEVIKAAGFKNPDKFLKPPQIDPQTGQAKMPPPPPNPLVQAEEAKQQGAMQIKQMDVQADAMKMQAQVQVDRERAQNELAVQQANDERQLTLDRERLAAEQATEIQKAQIAAAAQIVVARVNNGIDDATTDVRDTLVQTVTQIAGAMQGMQGLLSAMQEMIREQASMTQQHAQNMAAHVQAANAPKRIVRDPVTGRAIGVETVRPTIQ